VSADIHQVRYGWSERTLLGARGTGPLESTMPDDVLAAWDPHLRDHVWAVSSAPAFTFLLLGDVGVLIRKIATDAEEGRPGSAAHVLLGEVLTAERALGLTCWSGWDVPLLEGKPWVVVDTAATSGLAEVRARARKLPPNRLAGMFVSLLDEPRAAYTVIGEPDPIALICALGDLHGRVPTFASDEADDNGPRLPTAVFLREPPVSVTVATRRRLVPVEASADPTVASFAAAAVDAYVDDGVHGIAHVRPPEPPADATAARGWAAAAQLIPGVLADLTRLRTLSPVDLTGLKQPESLKRIAAVASSATSVHLGDAITRAALPHQIAVLIVEEALSRVFADPHEEYLLGRLAAVGPLPLQMLAEHPPIGFDRLVRVGRALLTPADRQILVQRAAASTRFADLIGWIDERAASVPEDAASAYLALCDLAERAVKADGRAVAECGALVDAVRFFSGTEQQTASQVARLLAALPKRVLTREVVAELANRGDPALLRALDEVIIDPDGLDTIHRAVRHAFYIAHRMDVPESEPGPADGSRWRRPRRRHASDRKRI